MTNDIVERLNRADNLAIPGEPRSIFCDAAAEIARLRLTDAERKAVERAADLIDAKTCGDSPTLRGLLERLAWFFATEHDKRAIEHTEHGGKCKVLHSDATAKRE